MNGMQIISIYFKIQTAPKAWEEEEEEPLYVKMQMNGLNDGVKQFVHI